VNLFFGAGCKYDYWRIEVGNFSNDVVIGKMDVLMPMINVGYKATITDKTYAEFELEGGYGWLLTHSNKRSGAYEQKTFIVSPKVGLYMKANDILYFGLMFNYVYMGAEFTPENINVSSFPAAVPSQNIGKYQYFSV